MAYATYTTEALVCGTFDRNTADRSYLLFTKDAGMLYADARSVRTEKSKQRFALQDFSAIRVSLVKGKAGWKIGSVEAQTNHYMKATDKAARGSVVNVYRWLRRFIKGEEAAPELYEYILSALAVVTKDVPERLYVEDVIKLRILTELGYVDKKKVPASVLEEPSDIVEADKSKDEVIIERLLSQAVSSSHL